jgi:hypothetical protein
MYMSVGLRRPGRQQPHGISHKLRAPETLDEISFEGNAYVEKVYSFLKERLVIIQFAGRFWLHRPVQTREWR